MLLGSWSWSQHLCKQRLKETHECCFIVEDRPHGQHLYAFLFFGAKPHEILFRSYEYRARQCSAALQFVNFVRGINMMVREGVGFNKGGAGFTQCREEFFRTANSGKGDDSPVVKPLCGGEPRS